MVPVPATLQPRSQSYRNGVRQTQGAPAIRQSPNHRCSLASRRQYLRPLLSRRMPPLSQTRRVCCRLNARCSKCWRPGIRTRQCDIRHSRHHPSRNIGRVLAQSTAAEEGCLRCVPQGIARSLSGAWRVRERISSKDADPLHVDPPVRRPCTYACAHSPRTSHR